ncbi:23S rRNA (adenine(2503)-C(2))-methyltransferase RlmN [Novosphingobium lubricantis]|jgi:23S rRNA (adenine2503-C2)-methyltransferase
MQRGDRWEPIWRAKVSARVFALAPDWPYMRAMQIPPEHTPSPASYMPIPGHIDPVPVPRPITPREDGRVDLIGLPRQEIATIFAQAGLDAKAAKLRAKQVFHWLYHRGVTDFDAMTDIAKTMRPWLAERFVIGRPEIVEAQVSTDGTRKWLLRTADNHDFEMVFIPDADRGTLCVSSQVGCTLNCRFCHTGTMRLVRNLTPGEIVGQVMLARDALGEWPKAGGTMAGLDFDDDDEEQAAAYTPDGRLLTNIVMMGMGEPLYNFDNVRDALKLVMDGDGLALSKRRITLSTSGVVPMMARCGAEIGVNLAVSLHAVTKDVRDEIVPINRKFGLEELLQACADYPGASNARRITFEYVMLRDKNDSDDDARELVRLIKHYRLPAKVNLIPFNPWPGAPYECSTPERIRRFAEIVFDAGISAPVRTPRGRDIDAACGQLKTAAERKSRAELDRLAEEKQAALG